MEQDDSIAGDNVWINTHIREEQCRAHVGEEFLLDFNGEDETELE